MPVRFCLTRDAWLLCEVLGRFVQALFGSQRRTARDLGVARPLTGVVAFVQRFGSALRVFEKVHSKEMRLHPPRRAMEPSLPSSPRRVDARMREGITMRLAMEGAAT